MTKPTLGDAPIEPRYIEQMQHLAQTLDRYFNEDLHGKDRHTGFVVLVYPFAAMEQGDPRCNFISNGADRRDIVALFKEMIARFEGQPEMKGKA